jgi:DNA repair protein RecN (Recombination protein N)
MLTRLRVRNLLLIEEAVIEPSGGLTVLTGETGAGKSMLLHALALLLGRPGSPDWIRRGADALQVEGVFRAGSRARRVARESGIALARDELLVSRELRRAGGSRGFVNGQRVTMDRLARLGEQLVEIHGQREEERFRRSDAQRDLLDLFGAHETLRREVRDAYRDERAAAAELTRVRSEHARLARDEDWTRFQLEELERLGPQPAETETLRERIAALRSAAGRAEFIALAEELLNGRAGAVLESLEELDHRVAALDDADPALAGWRARAAELLAAARALHRELRALKAQGDDAPAELTACEQRLAELERLQRKHRRPLAEIPTLAADMRDSLARLADAERNARALTATLAERGERLAGEAAQLTTQRERVAVPFARALERELSAIEMQHCRLRVAFTPLADPAVADSVDAAGSAAPAGRRIGIAGAERVDFLIETNPGEGFRPLGEIASGGEMARIALSLRVVLGKRGRSQLAVFDEIDAGLGGGAARAVAQRLARVARDRQVLLVTHLPVIAAHAGRHYLVSKRDLAEGARVDVSGVDGEERVAEIARMLSGRPRDREAREHARAMLAQGIPLPETGGSA